MPRHSCSTAGVHRILRAGAAGAMAELTRMLGVLLARHRGRPGEHSITYPYPLTAIGLDAARSLETIWSEDVLTAAPETHMMRRLGRRLKRPDWSTLWTACARRAG